MGGGYSSLDPESLILFIRLNMQDVAGYAQLIFWKETDSGNCARCILMTLTVIHDKFLFA